MSNQLIPPHVEVRSAAIFSEIDAEKCARICPFWPTGDQNEQEGSRRLYCPVLESLRSITSGPELWKAVQELYRRGKGKTPPAKACYKGLCYDSIATFLEPKMDDDDQT